MAIVEITPAQADQHIKQRWATHTTCNGNCMAGRPCDCTAAVDTDEAANLAQFTKRDNLRFLAPVVNVCLILLLFVLHQFGVLK